MNNETTLKKAIDRASDFIYELEFWRNLKEHEKEESEKEGSKKPPYLQLL